MTDHQSEGGAPRRLDRHQIATIAAAILLLWFAIANWQHVTIHFWIMTAHAPLTLVIAVSAALGGFMIWLAKRRARASRSRR